MRFTLEQSIGYLKNECNYLLSNYWYQQYSDYIQPQHCFDNADFLMRRLSERGELPSIVYGYVVSGVPNHTGVYITHGWNLIGNQFVDVTSIQYGYDNIDFENFGYIPYFILNEIEYQIMIQHNNVMPDVIMQQDVEFRSRIEQMGYRNAQKSLENIQTYIY